MTGNSDYENVLHTKLDTILDLVYEGDTSNILQIRKLLYNVCTHNINRCDILKYCFLQTVSKLETTQQKIDLLNFTYEINTKLHSSFKTTIHIEYYLIALMNFIK